MKRKLAAILMAAVMITSSSFNANAGNTEDKKFDFSVNATNYSQTTKERDKQDKTAVYLKLTYLEDRSSIYVRALGGTDGRNLTENGTTGVLCDHVTCMMGTQYSIHSQIYEKGYRVAKLAFKSKNLVNSETAKGVWSPDSTRNYTHAYMW